MWNQHNIIHMYGQKKRCWWRIKSVNRQSISAIKDSSTYAMPEVCQCVLSAHGCCHRSSNNKPLPLHQPCSLLDWLRTECRYGWEQGWLFTQYVCMWMCVWGKGWSSYLLTKFPWSQTTMTNNSSPLSFYGQFYKTDGPRPISLCPQHINSI